MVKGNTLAGNRYSLFRAYELPCTGMTEGEFFLVTGAFMAFTGIASVVYGAPDPAQARKLGAAAAS